MFDDDDSVDRVGGVPDGYMTADDYAEHEHLARMSRANWFHGVLQNAGKPEKGLYSFTPEGKQTVEHIVETVRSITGINSSDIHVNVGEFGSVDVLVESETLQFSEERLKILIDVIKQSAVTWIDINPNAKKLTLGFSIPDVMKRIQN